MIGSDDPGAPAVAVVIPARNAEATIAAQLTALARQEYTGRWRVVVVDDGSDDETGATAEAFIPTFPVELTVLRNPRNQGTGAARNIGVLSTSEPLILFCDSDDEVGEGWLAALAVALSDADGAGGQLELRRLNSPRMFQWASIDVDQTHAPRWSTPHVWGMPSPTGACCAVTRSAWSAVGGFTEQMFPGEDTDFYWRLQCRGLTITEVSDAVVHYRVAGSPRRQLAKLFRSGQVHTMLLWAYRHPKRRRQLSIETAGTLRRAYRVLIPATRSQAIYNLVFVAGRLTGLIMRVGQHGIGPDVPPRSDP